MCVIKVEFLLGGCVTGAQAAKKSGIPAPREISSSITRDRTSLREQLRSSSAKRMVTSASTSSLSTLTKQTRGSTKSRTDAEGQERALLESQVKELLAEAKAKDSEISSLRTELQCCKERASSATSSPSPHTVSWQEPRADQEQVAEALVLVGELREKNGKFQRELAVLREENQALKEKLLSLEASPPSDSDNGAPIRSLANGLPSDSGQQLDTFPSAVSPLKTSVSSNSDITKGSPSPDSSEFEKIPSRSESASSNVSGVVAKGVSVQILTEQIHKMEECHHSTAEELQATLQELADQQQVVQELTTENERLAEERRLLQTSLQQQRERVELLAQKNESLAGRLQEQVQAQAQREEELGSHGPRLAEMEQRYGELVESSRFEREKLVDIQQQLTGSLRALEEEHQEAQGQARRLGEEVEHLQARLSEEQEATGQAALAVEEQRAAAETLRLESNRLKAQLDGERQKMEELKALQSAGDGSEAQSLLKTAHAERERLEGELAELKQELLQVRAECEHMQMALCTVGREWHLPVCRMCQFVCWYNNKLTPTAD